MIERARDLIDRRVRARAHVRAGMQHDGVDAEALRAIELVDHGGDRLAVELRVRRGEVDQIRRVREQRPHGALRREQRAVLVGERLALPLIRVLREQRRGGRVDRRARARKSCAGRPCVERCAPMRSPGASGKGKRDMRPGFKRVTAV